MKISVLFLGLACILPVAVSAQDDVYYIPSKDIRQVTSSNGTVVPTTTVAVTTTTKAKYYKDSVSVDEYNRRGTISSVSQADYDADTLATVESTFDDSAEQVSYPCTKLVMRFHSPHVGYIVSSPYYWDICYSDCWDVYYDGWAASYVPSYVYWSYAYDPWYYNRWHFRTCWDFTWGWYDPWWSRSYWGWGRPIYWGWSRPYYHPRHISRPMWTSHSFHRGYAPGFGHHGGRTFPLRGIDNHRDFAGSRAGFGGARHDGGRPLSGVFRGDRTPSRSTQMSMGNRRTGPNSVMRGGNFDRNNGGFSRGGNFDRNNGEFSRGGSRNGGGGVVRGGTRPNSNFTPQRGTQQRTAPQTQSRPSAPRSYTPSSSSSRPSGGGGFSHGGGSSSSPSHSGGGGFSRGGSSGGGGSHGGGGGVVRSGRR